MLHRSAFFTGFWFLLSVFFSVAYAGEFSADMVSGYPGNTETSKVFMDGDRYRLDVTEDDRTLWVIVDKKAGLTRLVSPADKMYVEMEYSNPRTMMNDPFRALQYHMDNFDTREEGKEKIDGRECEKIVVYKDARDMYTAWICGSLGAPVKIVNHLVDGMFVELRDIEEGEVEDGLFKVPEGYAKVERFPAPMPEWGDDVAKAPLLKAPFEKELAEGQIVRVKQLAGKKVKIKGKNLTDGRGSMTVAVFKDGRPVKDPQSYGFSRQGQGVRVGPLKSVADADEIVIRSRKGTIRATVEYVDE